MSEIITWPQEEIFRPIVCESHQEARRAVKEGLESAMITGQILVENARHRFKKNKDELYIITDIERNGDAVCNFEIDSSSVPFEPTFKLEIGGQIIYSTKEADKMSKIFTYKSPIILIALQYHMVRLIASFDNKKDKVKNYVLENDTPVSFKYDEIYYDDNTRVIYSQSRHVMDIPGTDKCLRIKGGMGGLSNKSITTSPEEETKKGWW